MILLLQNNHSDMEDKHMKHHGDSRTLDIVLVLCLIAVMVVNIALYGWISKPKAVGAAEVPDDAVTLTGSADGRNGPIEVEVTATADNRSQACGNGRHRFDRRAAAPRADL